MFVDYFIMWCHIRCKYHFKYVLFEEYKISLYV